MIQRCHQACFQFEVLAELYPGELHGYNPVVLSLIAFGLLPVVPRLSAQDDIFVTPIPNAPFSGVVHVERSMVRRDGSVRSVKTVRAIHRDAFGRIYNEYRMLLPASSNE